MTSMTSTTRTGAGLATGTKPAAPAGWLPYAAWPLPADPSAAPRARTAVRRALSSLGVAGECLDDALVCVSELATNAIVHAPGPHELRLLVRGGAIVCEITDADRRPVVFPPQAAPTGLGQPDARESTPLPCLAEHGRGLSLVALLSGGQCGTRPVPGGKGVWFALPLAWPSA